MTGLKGWKLWTLIAIFVACAAVPLVVQNNYVMQILFRIAIFAAMGLAWNVVGGTPDSFLSATLLSSVWVLTGSRSSLMPAFLCGFHCSWPLLWPPCFPR